MRSLSSTLTAAQKAGGNALCKVVLTSGANSYTYGVDTANPLLLLRHKEAPFLMTADILVNNFDNTLTGLNLSGYKGVISWGYNTSAGDEYSACAPLWVLGQQGYSYRGALITSLSLAGIPNFLAEDRANDDDDDNSADTSTVKTRITSILAATLLAAFDHSTAYTVTYDSEDSLIDSFQPKELFLVNYQTSTRLALVKQLLAWTKCVMRVEADEAVHILVPRISGAAWAANTAYVVNDYAQPVTPNDNFTYQCTTAGTSHATTEPTWPTTAGGTVTDGTVVWTARGFDYEYTLVAGDHNFFEKSVRERLVIPNKVTVESDPSHSAIYSGTATHATSNAVKAVEEFHRLRLASSAQATSIAKAMIEHYRLDEEEGFGKALINCGAEIYDYVKITDSRANDLRKGNIGYLEREYKPGKFEMSFRFGSINMNRLAGVMPPHLDSAKQAVPELTGDGFGSDIDFMYGVLTDVVAAMVEMQRQIEEKKILLTTNMLLYAEHTLTGAADMTHSPTFIDTPTKVMSGAADMTHSPSLDTPTKAWS